MTIQVVKYTILNNPYAAFYRRSVLAHMSMVTKVKHAGNMNDIPPLKPEDQLKKETQNERLAVMKIVSAIQHHLHLGPKDIKVELSHRPDGNWNSPGEQIDLMFLQKYRKHHTAQA